VFLQQVFRAARNVFCINSVCCKRVVALKIFCTDDVMSGSLTAEIDQKRANQCRVIRGDSSLQRANLVA